ncbi:hypothetical protein [Xenorhabdus stockiae]|uniref:hypothetical protein n=1 Tax=Xenorhabdus stockiae TaxID=351614 RepID=UPI00406368E5
MSLTENIARRKPRTTELLESVKQLKIQGLTDKEIGERLGYVVSWINGVIKIADLLSAIQRVSLLSAAIH